MLDSNSCVAEISYKLLIERVFDPKDFMSAWDINRRKLQRYISIIKTRLQNMELYHITIIYKRSEDVYICEINE